MDKYQMLLDFERQFAREVTLGVIVSRPLSAWMYLLPGKFIFDYFHRNRAIREYTRDFIFPRKLAMDAARSRMEANDDGHLDSQLEADIEKWLRSQKIYSPHLARKQKAVVDLLAGHYLKLLEAEGIGYPSLIRNAYTSRDAFQAHVHKLSAAEKEVDRAILDAVGKNDKLREKLEIEAQQVAKRRDRILEDIF